MGSILKGLGVKGDPKYPTPEEFVRASHGFEDSSRGGTNFVSASTLGLGGNSAPLGMPASGVGGLLQVQELLFVKTHRIESTYNNCSFVRGRFLTNISGYEGMKYEFSHLGRNLHTWVGISIPRYEVSNLGMKFYPWT
jgi:hypothetical protein